LPIITPGIIYPLSYYVDLSYEAAPTTIARSDGDRSVNISSDLEADFLSGEVLPLFQEQFQPNFEIGYRVEFGGETEEMAESFASLGKAMIAGMFLILIILIIQFNSFKQSLIILFTIPLALIGVFFGLAAVMLPLSFPAFIGVVALAGIVVNNAIILIDRINKNIAEGNSKEEAILSAGSSRFQPILLTSITTVAGILPLALSDPGWGPLGFSIIFGLLFSTILTLFVIPAAYQLFIKPPELSEIQGQ
jgi:multidrug efflux pump subunit AcrB